MTVASDDKAWTRKLRDNARKLATAETRANELRRERDELWAEARAADPPVRLRTIADIYGVHHSRVGQAIEALTNDN